MSKVCPELTPLWEEGDAALCEFRLRKLFTTGYILLYIRPTLLIALTGNVDGAGCAALEIRIYGLDA